MKYHFDIPGDDFSFAGNASSEIKKTLKSLQIPADIIKRVVIALFEAETNMIVHADGGTIDFELTDNCIIITVEDNGPGIPDIDKAMVEGYSTANNVYVELGYGAGMGLSNIQRNTDKLIINSNPGKGTTLIMNVFYEK